MNDDLKLRIEAQIQEANQLGFEKLASDLSSVDRDEAFSAEEAEDFLNKKAWQAVVALANFYAKPQIRVEDFQRIIEKTSESLINEVCEILEK